MTLVHRQSRPSEPSGRRLEVFDAARGAALLLVIAVHAVVRLSPDTTQLDPLFRIATPTFLMVFGAMLEIAYLAPMREGRRRLAERRRSVLARGLVCWALLAVTIFAGVLGGWIATWRVPGLLLLVDAGTMNSLLRWYALAMILCALALPWLERVGPWGVLGLGAGTLAVGLALEHAGVQAGFLGGLLFGTEVHASRNLLPQLVFVGAGLALGQAVVSPPGTPRARRALVALAAVALASVAVLVHAVASEGAEAFATNVGRNHRAWGDPAYYAWGMLGASALVWLLHVFGRLPAAAPLLDVVARLGRRSLFGYAFSGVVLMLMPAWRPGGLAGLVAVAVFTLIMAAITLDIASPRSRIDRLAGRWPSRLGDAGRRLADGTAAFLARRLPGGDGIDARATS